MKSLLTKIELALGQLSAAERRIGEYIIQQPDAIPHMTTKLDQPRHQRRYACRRNEAAMES